MAVLHADPAVGGEPAGVYKALGLEALIEGEGARVALVTSWGGGIIMRHGAS